jgi:SAM-dependent methyltransferase
MLISKKEIDDLKKKIQEAFDAAFSGWDFSYTEQYGGKPEFPCPWDYEKTLSPYIQRSKSLLDLGTGGGEFLSTLKSLPQKVIATEGYKPNVHLAKKRLRPLGIDVVEVTDGIQESAHLPFDDNSFDLIINRHESYESRELYRILKPSGIFITQQVGSRDLERLVTICGSLTRQPETFIWNVHNAVTFLNEAGMCIIEQKDHITSTRFYDIRVVVYFMKILVWHFPDFHPELYEKQLENIYFLIKRDGFFEDICHRFFIIAKKP